MNVSSSFLESFVEESNVSLAIGMVSGINNEDLAGWSILSEDDVKNKFVELYEFGDINGVFGIDISFNGFIMNIGVDSKFRVYVFDWMVKTCVYVFLEGIRTLIWFL